MDGCGCTAAACSCIGYYSHVHSGQRLRQEPMRRFMRCTTLIHSQLNCKVLSYTYSKGHHKQLQGNVHMCVCSNESEGVLHDSIYISMVAQLYLTS